MIEKVRADRLLGYVTALAEELCQDAEARGEDIGKAFAELGVIGTMSICLALVPVEDQAKKEEILKDLEERVRTGSDLFRGKFAEIVGSLQ